MGLRFRKSLKVIPGVRMNFGKGGLTSVSVGRRGNTLNFGPKGTTHTVGLPGTGLSYRSSTPRRQSGSQPRALVGSEATSTRDLSHYFERFGIQVDPLPDDAGRTKRWLALVGVLLVLGSAVALIAFQLNALAPVLIGLVICLVAGQMKSREDLERETVRAAHSKAEAELQRRQTEFTGALTACDLRNREDVHETVARCLALQLDDADHVALGTEAWRAWEEVEALSVFYAFESQLNGQIRSLEDPEVARIIEPDPSCFFQSPCVHDVRGDRDPSGTLYLTNRRAFFASPDGTASIDWTRIVAVGRDGRALKLQRKDRVSSNIFRFPTVAGAMKAVFMCENVRAFAGQASAQVD